MTTRQATLDLGVNGPTPSGRKRPDGVATTLDRRGEFSEMANRPSRLVVWPVDGEGRAMPPDTRPL